MTSDERIELAELRMRLFGLDGNSGLAGDVADIKEELAEWRGAIRFIKVASTFVGFGGLLVIFRALVP